MLAATSCATPTPAVLEPVIRAVGSPAPAGSRAPNLARDSGGRVILSWVESSRDRSRLRVSVRSHGSPWSDVRTAGEGQDWFVNWADFPAVATSDGRLCVATWLASNGPATHAYAVHFALSHDGGLQWSDKGVLHTDRSATEHGFVSLTRLDPDRFAAVWLDGRHTPPEGAAAGSEDPGGAMALFTTVIESDGSRTKEVQLDDRVCDCCQTSAVLTDDGFLVVAYRDRSNEEVRDISVIRGRPADTQSWSPPKVAHRDGWKMPGCPVNGPALAASGQRVALAWYTHGADNTPRVHVAFSPDGGRSFASPLAVDDGQPMGRVDACFLPGGELVVSWLDVIEGQAEWRARVLSKAGRPGPSRTIAAATGARSDGFLRLERLGERLLAAWTDPAGRGVRVALITARRVDRDARATGVAPSS